MAIELPEFPASDEPGIDELNRRTAKRTEFNKLAGKRSSEMNALAMVTLFVAAVVAIAGYVWGAKVAELCFRQAAAAGGVSAFKVLYWEGCAEFALNSHIFLPVFLFVNFGCYMGIRIEVDRIDRIVSNYDGYGFGGASDTLASIYTLGSLALMLFGGAFGALYALLTHTSEYSYLYRVNMTRNAMMTVAAYFLLATAGMGLFRAIETSRPRRGGELETREGREVRRSYEEGGYRDYARKHGHIPPQPDGVWEGK